VAKSVRTAEYTTSVTSGSLADLATGDENYRLNRTTTSSCANGSFYQPPYAFIGANGFGKYSNEFYNQYTVRDAWWENKTGPLTTYIGNQIVVWANRWPSAS